MIPAHLADFWDAPRLATCGTVRPDGSAHLVPVKGIRLGERFAVLTRPETVKARNVARQGRASLAEHTDGLWATVEGTAWLDDDPTTLEAARAAYAVRFGRPSTWGTVVMMLEPDLVLHGE